MLICCGGVCVPYTAVVPLVLLALKWVATKLAQMGLLPERVAAALQVSAAKSIERASCCTAPITEAGPSLVGDLVSKEELDELLQTADHKVVCKFTAGWCQPCKAVHPSYEKLSSRYGKNISFLTIDVDDFDEIASKYQIAMMPTFLVLQADSVLGTYRGSNEYELQQFLKEQLGAETAK